MRKTLKKYVIPHAENDYAPYLLRRSAVLVFSFIILLLFFGSFLQSVVIVETDFLATVLPGVLVGLVNDERAENNLNPLSMNPTLQKAAKKKALDMAARGYFSHNSPEGLAPWHWFNEEGYIFAHAGENLAINFYDSKDVHDAWVSSSGHKENILNQNFNEIGIATAKGTYEGKETIFVVQFFGKRAFDNTKDSASVIATASDGNEEGFPEGAAGSGGGGPKVLDRAISQAAEGMQASFLEEIASSPKRTLSYLYIFLGGLILITLVITIFVEIKKQHPLHILYAVLALLLIIVLTYINQELIFPEVLIL